MVTHPLLDQGTCTGANSLHHYNYRGGNTGSVPSQRSNPQREKLKDKVPTIINGHTPYYYYVVGAVSMEGGGVISIIHKSREVCY